MSIDDRCGEVRTLVVLAPGFDSAYPELVALSASGSDWRVLPELGAVCATVGGTSRWRNPEAVINCLRSLLDAERVSVLRGVWLAADVDPRDHVAGLLHAQPLLELVPAEPTPLARLLHERRLETWLQPIFRAGELELWGFECLMRGRAEDGTLINPGRLLAWARRQQLTGMLDCTAREIHLQNVGRAGLPEHTHVLINFLPSTAHHPDHCLQSSLEIAAAHHIDPHRIIFEVVESESVDDHAHLADILSLYREQGFKVALDDVGNGHSGLIMLADLDPDLIKIDRYLVQRAAQSRAHRRVCASLIEFAHEQDKLILAEGVETAEEKSIMDHLGVDLYQGYLFAAPSPEPVTTPQLAVGHVG